MPRPELWGFTPTIYYPDQSPSWNKNNCRCLFAPDFVLAVFSFFLSFGIWNDTINSSTFLTPCLHAARAIYNACFGE